MMMQNSAYEIFFLSSGSGILEQKEHTTPQNGRFCKLKIEADGGFLLATYRLLNITPQK
jgi:hypothetical protein